MKKKVVTHLFSTSSRIVRLGSFTLSGAVFGDVPSLLTCVAGNSRTQEAMEQTLQVVNFERFTTLKAGESSSETRGDAPILTEKLTAYTVT